MGLKELKAKLKVALEAARVICKAAEDEERDFTAEERQQVAGYLEEAKGLKGQISQVASDEAMRKALAELGVGLGDESTPAAGQDVSNIAGPGRGMSIGEQFVEAEAYKAWMQQIAPSGAIPEGARGLISPPVEFKSLFPRRKDVVTGAGDTSAGAFVVTDYTGIYEPIGYWPLVIRNLISVRTTTSDLVEFVRQTAQVAQAAPVPESNVTEYSGATGEVSGEKPEASMTFEKVQEPVKTIAVWIPATKRALSDAAQLRGLIDQELREDLEQELEDQLLNGNGVGENFTGLANTAGVLAQVWNTDILTTTRQAITTLLVTGRQRPTGWVFNPQDWETVELLQDLQGRYYWGGPLSQGRPQLWGVPVVQSFYQAQGRAWLGNWSKAVLWDRERASIQVSDSHADFFIRNMVAILAEMRAAFGVIRPSAFIEVDLESGS